MALGTMQIVASLLVGACWFLMGVGVAMCTDAGPNPRCSRIFSLWGWAGASVLLSMLGGAALMAGGQAARGTRWRAATAWFAGLAAVVLLVAVAAFWSAASAPLNG